MSTLSSTYPYYVRCIKPNTRKVADNFDPEMVLAQLRYCGMLETIRIRKLGFPIRKEFKPFRDRYRLLAPRSTQIANDRSLSALCSLLELIFTLCQRLWLAPYISLFFLSLSLVHGSSVYSYHTQMDSSHLFFNTFLREACQVILHAVSYRLTPGHYTLGLTKVFLRDEQVRIKSQTAFLNFSALITRVSFTPLVFLVSFVRRNT